MSNCLFKRVFFFSMWVDAFVTLEGFVYNSIIQFDCAFHGKMNFCAVKILGFCVKILEFFLFVFYFLWNGCEHERSWYILVFFWGLKEIGYMEVLNSWMRIWDISSKYCCPKLGGNRNLCENRNVVDGVMIVKIFRDFYNSHLGFCDIMKFTRKWFISLMYHVYGEWLESK